MGVDGQTCCQITKNDCSLLPLLVSLFCRISISSDTKSSKSKTTSTITSTGGTEVDAAGGVCRGVTNVERTAGGTGGEADIVVAGVVNIDQSAKTDTIRFKIMK